MVKQCCVDFRNVKPKEEDLGIMGAAILKQAGDTDQGLWKWIHTMICGDF